MKTYQLRQVFSRGLPTVTYVDRSHLGLEKQLADAVTSGHAIIAVTGPSKCGKTVLRKKVVPDPQTVSVEGGHVGEEADFWVAIAQQLGMPTGRSATATKTKTASDEAEAGISLAPVSAKYKEGESNASSLSESKFFSGVDKKNLLDNIISSGKTLIVDDFHYIGRETRAAIIRALKAPVFDGLSVVMLSVPYRAFDVLSAESEMEGRFTHISIPPWSEADLSRIAQLGFPALGLTVTQASAAAIAAEVLGSPLLMQSVCARICLDEGVTETVYPERDLDITREKQENCFRTIAKDFGLPGFQKLARGPSRTDRIARKFSNGKEGDIYEAVLAAIAYSGANDQVDYDDLRSALRQILLDNVPQKHEITRAIQHMCAIARRIQKSGVVESTDSASVPDRDDQIEDDDRVDVPAVDWKDDVVYLNDVFLRFFLRWVHRHEVRPLA